MRKRVAFGSGVVLLAILVTLVVWQGSFNLDQFAPSSIQQTLLFWAVSTLVFILTVMLGFILFRTGVRSYIERQSNRPGSHIKSKLIGGALALSALPVIFLVLFSVSVLNRNLDSWFSRPARSMNVDLTQVGAAFDQEVRDKLAAQAHWLASRSLSESADFYEQFCMTNEIEHAEIENPRGVKRVLCSVPKAHDGELYTAQIKTNAGLLTLSARMPLNLAAKQQEINGYVAEYNQLAVDRKAFRSLYLLLLSLITLFILFFAIWIARYMASQISTPITALLKAAEQIRKGNLGYRVHVNAIDEMATLVKAFNEMTEALETNSKELESRRRFTEDSGEHTDRRHLTHLRWPHPACQSRADGNLPGGTSHARGAFGRSLHARRYSRDPVSDEPRPPHWRCRHATGVQSRAWDPAPGADCGRSRCAEKRGLRAGGGRYQRAPACAEIRGLARGGASRGARDQESADAHLSVRRSHRPSTGTSRADGGNTPHLAGMLGDHRARSGKRAHTGGRILAVHSLPGGAAGGL
jgi:HAMP domain-containing protein